MGSSKDITENIALLIAIPKNIFSINPNLLCKILEVMLPVT